MSSPMALRAFPAVFFVALFAAPATGCQGEEGLAPWRALLPDQANIYVRAEVERLRESRLGQVLLRAPMAARFLEEMVEETGVDPHGLRRLEHGGLEDHEHRNSRHVLLLEGRELDGARLARAIGSSHTRFEEEKVAGRKAWVPEEEQRDLPWLGAVVELAPGVLLLAQPVDLAVQGLSRLDARKAWKPSPALEGLLRDAARGDLFFAITQRDALDALAESLEEEGEEPLSLEGFALRLEASPRVRAWLTLRPGPGVSAGRLADRLDRKVEALAAKLKGDGYQLAAQLLERVRFRFTPEEVVTDFVLEDRYVQVLPTAVLGLFWVGKEVRER